MIRRIMDRGSGHGLLHLQAGRRDFGNTARRPNLALRYMGERHIIDSKAKTVRFSLKMKRK